MTGPTAEQALEFQRTLAELAHEIKVLGDEIREHIAEHDRERTTTETLRSALEMTQAIVTTALEQEGAEG